MLVALRPENCDVLWGLCFEEFVLHFVVGIRGGYGFCLWVFGSGREGGLLYLGVLWWVFC